MRSGALVAVAAALLGSSVPRARAADDPTVKAEMLCNIAKFVHWPEASLARTQGQIVFSILGEDELAAALAGTLSTKTINGREVFVRFIRRPQDAKGSQMLFIAASEMEKLPEVLKAVGGTPCLTVADSEGFLERGGMVDFERQRDRQRFGIHLGRAQAAGLRISAKLLSLARVVE